MYQALSALHLPSYPILTAYEGGSSITSLLQMRKLSLKKVKSLVSGHTFSKWCGQDF